MAIGRREFLVRATALGAGWALLPRLARALPGETGGMWLAGDLHCHTTYSHDVWAGPHDDNTGPDEFYTQGFTPAEQIANAASRKLDFLAITDHDDVRSLSDPGYLAARDALAGVLTMIPGYEHSMSRGHAGCLGVNHVMIDPATGSKINTSTDAGARALRDAIHAEGGIWIMNHPFDSDDATQSWGYSIDVAPDSIEVWNIHWLYRKEIFGVVGSTSNNHLSLPFWDRYIAHHGRMGANGGSDNHWRSTSQVQGVGQPTTWVYAQDRSVASILAAIAAGRTTVSAEPPSHGGVRAFLTAKLGSTEYMIGDTVPSGGGAIEVRARVLAGAGHMLRLWVDGVGAPPVPITSPLFEYTATLSPASHVRAEIYIDEGYWMGALTSPIYVS